MKWTILLTLLFTFVEESAAGLFRLRSERVSFSPLLSSSDANPNYHLDSRVLGESKYLPVSPPSPQSPPSPPSPPSEPSVAPHNITPRVAQSLLEDMLLGRVFEDKIAELYFKGKVTGFVHLYNGQEAVSTGVIKALRDDDFVVSTYRDHVHALSKGVSPREVMSELYGKETGCAKGRGGSMHMFSKEKNVVGGFAYIGEQMPVAVGTAFAAAYRRSLSMKNGTNGEKHDQVTACFMGDGSTNIGQFYESLNMAALLKLPILFIVENNNWAIGMAHYRSTSSTDIYKKGIAFGIPSHQIDGMNVLAVRSAAITAIKRARGGLGPTLIEALTYRTRGHSVADPDELRPPIERSTLGQRDPIEAYLSHVMIPLGYTTDSLVKITRQKIQSVVADALAFAESSPHPCVKDVAKGIFAESYKIPEGGLDTCTDTEISQYAEALRHELQIKNLTRMEKKNLIPIYEQVKPLKVID